jgi:hypothetical protein
MLHGTNHDYHIDRVRAASINLFPRLAKSVEKLWKTDRSILLAGGAAFDLEFSGGGPFGLEGSGFRVHFNSETGVRELMIMKRRQPQT